MRIVIGLLGATLLLAGCAHPKPAPNPAPVRSQPIKPVIKLDLRALGQVALVNAEARYVVISFPPGPLPQAEHRLNVYRSGLKVGEVKVTASQHGNDMVADIISGDIQIHDEVREE